MPSRKAGQSPLRIYESRSRRAVSQRSLLKPEYAGRPLQRCRSSTVPVQSMPLGPRRKTGSPPTLLTIQVHEALPALPIGGCCAAHALWMCPGLDWLSYGFALSGRLCFVIARSKSAWAGSFFESGFRIHFPDALRCAAEIERRRGFRASCLRGLEYGECGKDPGDQQHMA